MKRVRPSLLFLFLILSLLGGCTTTQTTPPQPAQAAAPVHVVFVGTTDVHGWFNGHDEPIGKTGQSIHYGGLPILASYVRALRAANPNHVVLVDSGDLFQGTLESNLFEGEPVIRAYNELGYTASAVGNHEFDFGPVGPDSVVRKPGQDPLGALKKNAHMASFPLLSANMVDKATGQTPDWARRSTTVTVDGAKIGIIGLSTPDTPNTTTADNVVTLSFTDPLAATVHEAAALRAGGADAIVVIAHMGGRCRDMNDVHDVASCDQDQEAMRFLQALPPGTVDAYFAGHTHQRMRQIVNGVPALQALAYSVEFATLDLWVDPAAHHVVATKTEMRPLTALCSDVFAGTENCEPRQAPPDFRLVKRVYEGTEIRPDETMAGLIAPYLERVAAKRNEPLGIRLGGPLTRVSNRESTLGDVLTDALRDVTGADIAFMNSGGIRANVRPGDLVYSDIFEASPFDNYPAVVTMTGAQVIEALRLSTGGDRGFLQVSGLHYTVDMAKDRDKPARQRNRILGVTAANGQPLDPAATYRVAMPDFLAKGGDALLPLMQTIQPERIQYDLTRPIRDQVIDAMKKWPMPVQPPPPTRITILNAPPPDLR